MKPKKRGLWFSALTLMLGVALLVTTLAAPQVRLVQSVPDAQEQTRTAALQGIQSPANIEISQDANLLADQLLRAQVLQHNKTNGTENGTTTDWTQLALLDVLSTVPDSNTVRDPALPNYDIIVPGSEGQYTFTLKNLETFDANYDLSITEGPETNDDFPILYRLRDSSGYLTGTGWVTLDALSSFPGIITALSSKDFVLEWKWDYSTNAAEDGSDTALGKKVQQESTIPFYQVMLRIYLEADDGHLWIHFDPQGGLVEPTEREYTRGDTYGTLPTPTKDGYVFVGWYDADGKLITSDMVIPDQGGTIYARWEEEKKDDDCKWWIPVVITLPILAIPIVVPGFIALIVTKIVACVTAIIAWICCNDNDEPTTRPDDTTTEPAEPTTKPDNEFEKPPKTGDSSTLLWGTLTAMFAAAGTAVIINKKRRRPEEDE